MSDEITVPESELRNGLVTQLRLAISFLTILPVIDQRPASDETVAASFWWFPIVGFVMGAALVGEDWLLAHFFGQVLRSVLLVASLVVVTGGIHLDGLADTADALGAGRDRARALEILRDSRVGTFGAAAIFFDLALKILALSTLAGHQRYGALIVAPMLARWAMLVVGGNLPYLRESGAGSTLLKRQTLSIQTYVFRSFINVTVLTVPAIFSPFPAWLLALSVAAAIAVPMHFFYRRWLGGVTGDLFGACGELVEIAVLLAMSA